MRKPEKEAASIVVWAITKIIKYNHSSLFGSVQQDCPLN